MRKTYHFSSAVRNRYASGSTTMKSRLHGKSASKVQVSNVAPRGFWLLADEREFYLPFKKFPWFRDATIRQLTKVERPRSHHLYWPELDIDVALDSIKHPGRYPLVSRPSPKVLQRTRRRSARH